MSSTTTSPVSPPHALAGRISMPGGKGRSLFYTAGCSVCLVFLALHSYIASKGRTVEVRCNAPYAAVAVDGNWVTLQNGSAQLNNVPLGKRQFTVNDADYFPLEQSLNVGWFWGSSITLTLTPRPVELTVRALPGSEVLVDGQPVGKVESDGQLRTNSVTPGMHHVAVRLAGYRDWEERFRARPPAIHFETWQPITEERRRQLEAQAQQLSQLLSHANEQYRTRQYQAALQTVNQVLALDPQNGFAQQLKSRIEQTLKVLGN